jgi:triosephosphate isomerase
MNTSIAEGVALATDLRAALAGVDGVDVMVFPPFTHLCSVGNALSGSAISLGAQNINWRPKGAFTGEVSAAMVRELATHVIIGHSERRQFFGDTDDEVNRKLIAALSAGLVPIVCVGESLEERDAGAVERVLERQVTLGLAGVNVGPDVMIAYEPVWAIGTGRAANGEQAEHAMGFIRAVVAKTCDTDLAERIRILYGGSVNAHNIGEFMLQPNVDGALVGGASLDAAAFAAIAIEAARARSE